MTRGLIFCILLLPTSILCQFWTGDSGPAPQPTGDVPGVLCPGRNEYYTCAPWYCPNTCEDYFRNGLPQECINVSPFNCEYSCRCYPGHYRNALGVCVPESECSAGCSDQNEILVTCPDPCPLTCDNLLTARPPCNKACAASGCTCKTNYVLDSNGKCVPPSSCPNLTCPPDRTLKRCVDWCTMPQTCDGFFNFIDCNGVQKECEPKCLCPEGLLDNGTACVTPDECCGLNAEAVDCGWRCDGTCEDRSPHSCNSMCLREVCVCKLGYVRPTEYDTNICIKLENCKDYIKCRGQNEEFNTCLDNCKPTCKSIATGLLPPGCGNSTSSTNRPTELCRGGCDCKPGYVRNDNNTCVDPKTCPPEPCKDNNAVRKPCGDPCPLTCNNITSTPDNCTQGCIVNGCACKDGFVLDANGKCVEILKCPCNGANETRTPCGDYCPLTCDNRNDKEPRICPEICFVNGCTCKPGYVRSRDGVCILPEECPPPPCEDTNAVRQPCGNPCPLTCENIDNPPQVCTEQCIINGCVCKEGFVLDSKGKCIEALQCPCKGANQTRTFCGDYCPTTCDNKDDKGPRICPAICYPNGCTCKPGYVRDHSGECVLPEECPCEDKNAIRKPCGDPCPLTCESCDDILQDCTKPCIVNGCACKEGFVLDGNGTCVEAVMCPCKGGNETRTECGDHCPVTCDSINNEEPRMICPAVCYVNSCSCTKGYLRNSAGECVLPEDCPLIPCKDKNASRKPCGDPCPLTCNNFEDPPKVCSKQCIISGCGCNEGFVLNEDKICVEELMCPCKGGNETRAECGDACPVTCENKDDKKPVICADADVCYVNECVCKKGYVRNNASDCILIEDCPPNPCADENAIRKPCGDPCPLTCDSMEHPPSPCNKTCINNGCACKEGFVLDASGKCIEALKCPCKGGNQTRTPCGNSCPITCYNKDEKEPRICPDICYENGCSCQTGYVRNLLGECISPEECESCSDQNAVIKPCGDPCPLTCDNLDNPPQVCTEQCIINGCVCKEGFVLDGDKKCIEALKCPCKNKNEIRTPCGDFCPVTCSNKNETTRMCPKICFRNGCTCKDGFVRNDDKQCIPPENCPKKCSKPNTVWKSCGSACPPSCRNRNPSCRKKCVAGCFCRPGYLLNEKGDCIRPRDCPTKYVG